ncbi:complex I subunit 5 family protein [Methanocella sp. MCL-LM]|uniref:complex I subunit 5 family protein n=1 Tax=Methanocella sp. MCL-LM TaxID=3412035 RepID=UPI003C792F1F
MNDYLALAPVILPVVGALIALAAYRYYRKAFEAFVIVYSVFLFLINLGYLLMLQGGMKPLSYGPLTLDASGMVISTVVCFLGLLVMFYSFAYKRRPQYDSTYFAAYLMMMGFMSGLACSSNVVIMLIFLEAATVISAVLVLFGRTKRSIQAATIYLTISIFEVLLVMYGAFILYNHTHSFDVTTNLALIPDSDKFLLALLFLFGFGTKAGLLPLGLIWLPPAHSEAPPPISATMSGILISASVVAMMRAVYPFYGSSGFDLVMLIVVSFGVLNMIVGMIMALFQEDLKRVLAYSSISQMGYIIVGLGLATSLGVYGALFHITNHMLFKGCLFLISGALILGVNTRQLHKMGGLGKRMPITAICFAIAGLAMAGLPLLNGAASKAAIEEATAHAATIWWGYEWFAYLQIIGSIVTFLYLFRAFYLIFLGKEKPGFDKSSDPPLYMLIPILIMVALCIILGLFPGLTEGLLQLAADSLLHTGA